jgi:hypothetical protein
MAAPSAPLRPEPLAPLHERAAAVLDVLRGTKLEAAYLATMARVDPVKIEDIQGRYARDIGSQHPKGHFKYLDVAYWAWIHSRKAYQLGVLRGPSKRVLDIGSGGGSFLAVLAASGHVPVGMDCPEPSFYAELCDAWGVSRVEEPVQFGRPFNSAVGRVQLITALSAVLDKKRGGLGGVPQWLAFLNYLTQEHLAFPGEMYLELNVQGVDGLDRLDPSLFELCAQAGAVQANAATGRLHFKLVEPLFFDAPEFAA